MRITTRNTAKESYIVVSRGLSYVTKCKKYTEALQEVDRLRKIGFKHPQIYSRCL